MLSPGMALWDLNALLTSTSPPVMAPPGCRGVCKRPCLRPYVDVCLSLRLPDSGLHSIWSLQGSGLLMECLHRGSRTHVRRAGLRAFEFFSLGTRHNVTPVLVGSPCCRLTTCGMSSVGRSALAMWSGAFKHMCCPFQSWPFFGRFHVVVESLAQNLLSAPSCFLCSQPPVSWVFRAE